MTDASAIVDHSAGHTVAIDIAIEDDAWAGVGDLETLARRAVDAALRESGDVLDDGAELSILLCDDAFIADLNQKWRGIAKPTNVLSCPVDAVSPALGDIVIAYGTVAREAAAEQKSLPDHLCHMIVHGLLHLLGFDHENEDDAEAMEALEIRTLASLGISSPYIEAPKTAEDSRFPR